MSQATVPLVHSQDPVVSPFAEAQQQPRLVPRAPRRLRAARSRPDGGRHRTSRHRLRPVRAGARRLAEAVPSTGCIAIRDSATTRRRSRPRSPRPSAGGDCRGGAVLACISKCIRDGCWMGGGSYAPEAVDLVRIREHISTTHPELHRLTRRASFRRVFQALEGKRLTRVPRGFQKDDPAAEYLKHRNSSSAGNSRRSSRRLATSTRRCSRPSRRRRPCAVPERAAGGERKEPAGPLRLTKVGCRSSAPRHRHSPVVQSGLSS